MAKDYAEMLRKAREGYAAATSGDTSGASKSGAKDYAKMLQDARNRVQGIQSNNDADAAQRASNARTVAARYYTNNLQYPGTVKKTPEQQSNDRVVYARQPEVQQQLKEHADKLRAGMEFKQTDEYKTGLQNRMSGASLSRSLAQNVPVVAPIKADETPVLNTAPATEAREVYKEKQETPYLPGLRDNSVAKQIGYLSEIAAAAVNLGAEDLKGGAKDLFNQITEGIAKGTETKQVGKVSLPSGIKKSTKPTFRTYSENQELGLDDGSNLIKSMLKASEDAWYLNSDTEETPAEKRIAEIENKYKYTNKSDVTNFLASALSGTGYGTQNIAGSLVSGGGLGNPVSASMTLFKGIRRNMRDAKRMGYSKDDAVGYATRQTLADTGLDAILNAAGAGVEQVAGKAIANIPSVYTRAAARTGVSALSEAAQSALSNIVSVANQKMTGNPDATIDWNSVARSAAVGGFSGALQQGIIEIVNLPTNARLAKRDYAVAEEYIKRATHVESDAEAEQMVQVGKKLLEYVDDLANEGTSESKARAKGWKAYKDTISAVVDDLENYGDRIVVDFAEKSDIVNNIINAPKADIVDGTADLVNKVAESIEPNENAVNATIDYIRDEIQKKQNEITMQTDPVLRRETEIDRLAIIEIEKTLRNKRAEIESARKKKLEEADAAETQPNTTPTTDGTEKTVETSEKPLTTAQENATIPVENTAQEQTVAKQPKQEERVETPKNETTAKQTDPGNKNIQTFTVDGRTVEIDTSKRAPNEFTLKHVVKKHSKTGEDLDVYQIPENLSSNEYARLKKNMVGIGGYYSSFVKGFIVPRDKIDRIEYFADVEEETPAQNVQQGEKSGIHVEQAEEKAAENTVQDSSETVVDSAEAKPIVEINKASGGETNEEQAAIADGSTSPASETEKAKAKIKKSVETAGFEYKSKNARNIGTAIANGALSLDNIVYGGKVNGFSDEQRKHFAETLIAGSYTDADTIHTKIPYDGTFDIKNNPTVIGNALDALKIKLSSAENVGGNSNANVKKIITLLQNAYTVASSKHDGTDYVTDGSILIKVSTENLSEIRSALDAKGNMQETQRDFLSMFDSDNIELLKVQPRKAYKIPASQKGGGITAVSFETPDGKETLFDSRYVKTFDGKENFWAAVKYKYAGDKYSLASVDKDGSINCLILPLNVSHTSNYEQVAFNSKSKLWAGKETENTYTGENYVENTDATLQTPEEPQPEQPRQQVVQETTQQVQKDQNKPASTQISDYVLDKLTNNGKITTQELQSIADKAHGGTMAEGKYDVKAMTDAMELGVNRYIIDTISNAQSDFNSPKAEKAVESIDEITESILNAIPTQTKRSEEQVSLQQFSTPPNIAYLASWVANIDNKDTVLEPSAGIGGLASFAKADGAKVYVNELSESRLEMLKQLPFDGFFKENAEQINNILPDSVSPSVVLMNPPFSSTGGRTKNSTKNAIPHIEQALLRLQDGGRLVAIVGKGMADDTPTFRNWYNELRKTYDIRANVGINGENYRKYGTTFDVQMLVIDKTGPQKGKTITGNYDDLREIPPLLEEVRNDKTKIGENAIQNPEAIHDKAVEELEIAREASSKAETALDAVKKMHDMYWFAENESAMSRGKKYSALSRPISKNASINRRDDVIKELKKGAVPVEKSGEYRLQFADKTFAIVVKSEHEFAEYLTSNKRSDESWDDALKRIQYHDGALEKAEKAYNDARSIESQKLEAAEEAYDALTKYRHAKWDTAVRKSQEQNNAIKKGEDVNDRSRENQQLETGESGRKDVGIHRGADVPKELGVADTIRENVSGDDSGVPLGVSEQGNSSGSGRIVADTENPQHTGIVQTDDGGSKRGRSDTGIRERSTDAKGLHEEVSDRGRGDMAVQRGDNAGHDIDGDGSTARRDKPRTRGDERLGRGDVAESDKQYHKAALDSSEDNGTYATYTPEKLNIKGAKPHPTKLVESSAMSSVHAPDLHYVPNLDRDIITKGVLSDAQLVAVMYAGQAHETVLPNGNRKGFLIGDGTGVGKGREISGIILDNFNSGRTKAVWVSVSSGLVNDARRDWVDLGGKESDVIDFSKEKGKKGGIGKFDKGIMFVSYDTLKSGKKGGETNADIIADWFGKDFDGVIVFDEAHKAGNLIAEKTGRGSKKPSQNAIKANDFQNSLKNARVVYASATIADKVSGLAFVSRLGLWGDGTQFSGVDDFVGKIGGSGMAAMELVARDMKATGTYISRNLSYDGVGYERLEHTLTKDQIYMYDTMSEGWQVVMQDVDKAMRITGNKSKNADSQLWSSMMRFYDQVLVSMSMPSVISDIEKQLADGKACVVQVVNTQEAAQERAVEKMREEGSEDYDNLDITPRQILEQYLLNSFPVEQYEKYIDENGNEQSRVARDSKGQPIINKEAVAMRDALLERIKDISIPEGPIDMLINHFGKDRVAEVSGRDRRFVNVTDENGNIKRVEDVRGDGAKNGSRAANDAEAKAFQNGEKDILIFSAQAGGTGYSYHADKRAKNSRQRVGYILQTAPNSQLLMQTIGRIHRSNEAFPPIYKLVSTDLSAQKRFVTSSARRLEQLGALTKGQRQASGGIFSADDNLETDLSSDALLAFFDRLGHGKIPGMDPKKILSKMGYTKYFYDEYGNFKLNKDTGSNVTRFLNRILALGVEDGNRVFDEFMDIRQAYYEAAEEAGTLDTGMENVKADKLDIVQRETVYTDESTGAETQYVQAKVYNKPTIIQTLDDAMAYRPQFQGIRRMEDGSVRAVYRIADQTNSFGVPVKRFRLQGANTAVSNTMSEKNMNAKTEEIPKAEWEAVWKEAVKEVPEYNESELHMITGALLPVWNKLPQDGNIKAMRITATDGTQYLGRVIPPKQIDAVLRSLGASKSSIKKQYTGKELYSAVMDKAQAVSFDGLYGATWTVSRRRVSGENRLEVTGRNLFAFKEKYPGVFTETIQYKQRYFIPTGSKGEEILGKLAENGVRSVGNPEPDDVAYYSKTQGNWGSRAGKDGKLPMPKNISDIYKAAKEIFGIAINSGKVKNGAEGVYNTHANTIRTRVYGDLPTIAHELGHMFDKRYKLSDMESVNELVKNYKTDLEEAGYNESLYPKEAVAMYFADLLHDGEYAQHKNPQFSTALFDAMSDIDKNKLADFKQMTENYFRMDDKERRRAQVRYRYKDKSTMGKAKFQVESFLRDPKGYMGKRSRDFMREVFDDVFELRYFDGAHTLAMRERQSDSIAKGRLEYAFTDNHGKVIGKSLKSVLYEGDITDLNKKDFEAYLIARVALDRLENNEKDPTAAYLVYADKDLGSKEALVNAILDYERENPTFADTANGVYEYRHNLLTVAVDSGIISEKLAKRMEKQLPHYVPLYRYVEDKNNVSPLAKFKGSGRDIYSPIENLATQTAAITKAIQKNETRKALFNAIDTNEDMGLWAEKVPPDKFFDRVSTQEIPDKIMKFLQSGGNGAMTDDDMVEFTEELMKYIGGSVGMWKIKNKQNDKIVSVMRNGVPEYYEMHDPGLLKALENMNPHKSNAFISLMGTATRISSTLVTSVSPRFGLFTNPIRDFNTGYIFSKTTNNPVTYTIDWFKAFIEAVRNTDDFKAYVANGGGYVGCITSKANVLRGIYKDMVKPSSKLKESINPRNWLESLSGLANAIDSAPRFAEYKRALEQNGGDVIAAVQEGMDVTVNFRQSGRTTKEINNLVMFNSARVTAIGQNSERIMKSRRIFAKFLIVNFLQTAMHIAALVLFSKMFDEGDEDTLKDYQNLSTYNKFANWCYPIGDGQFLRVPKEQNVMALSSVLDATWERFVLENPDAFKDMDEYLVDALMIADPNPMKAAGDLISDVTFFGTVLDLAKNETFTGAPIVPNGYQYRAAPEQYNEKTSALAIKLGSITGMSPFKIDYIIDDTTGFVGDVILNLTKQGGTTLKDAVGLKDTSKKSVLKGIPVPGVMLRDSVYSTDVVSNFYDTKEWYDKRSGSYDAVGEAGGKYSFYDTYGSYKYQKIADVYSKANARLKLEKNDEAKRLLRRAMNTFIQSANDTEKTKMDERIAKLAENTGYTVSDIAPYIVVPDSVSGKMPDGVKVSYYLDGYDLLDYYTMSQLYFQYYCNDILDSTASDEEKAEALKKAKREVKEDLNEIFFEKLK